MKETARSTSLARDALYNALYAATRPQFEAIRKECQAIGVRLIAKPAPTPS